MTFIEKMHLLERVDALIRKKGTGSPTQLARRLNIAESTLYEYIKVMKVMGAEISYDKDRQSYCYGEDYEFRFGFFKKQPPILYGGKKPKKYFNLLKNFSTKNLRPFLEIYQSGVI